MDRGSDNKYEKEELLSALNTVADKIGHSPSKTEYNENRDDSMASADTIRKRFDKWNIAKKEAGLEQREPKREGRPVEDPPENIDVDYETWSTWRRDRRWMKKKQSKLYELKIEMGCSRCGYNNHPSALDFHHTNEDKKEGSVSDLARNSSWDKVEDEIEKCELLCSNCHREKTANEEDLFVWGGK